MLLHADCFWTLEPDEAGGKYVAITLSKKSMGYGSWEKLLESERVEAVVTDRVSRLESSVDRMHVTHAIHWTIAGHKHGGRRLSSLKTVLGFGFWGLGFGRRKLSSCLIMFHFG
jgi:hypothetical protein